MAAWCYCVWELSVEDSVTGAWLLSSSKRLQIVANPFNFLVFPPHPPFFSTLFLSFFFPQFPLSLFLHHLTLSRCPSRPDHRPQTVEACVWWIRREPQQHKRCHVYTETLREVSYRAPHLEMTHYCYSCTRGTVCTAARTASALAHLHQIWFHNGLFIASGHYKTNIDFSSEVRIDELRHICRIVLAKVGQFAHHPSLSVLIVFRNAFLMGLN